MRKLILIIALTMVPLGIWTAGCRTDDRAAAFPDTPEMDALARSTGKVSEIADAEFAAKRQSAPYIPEKPIDRSVLGIPGDDTLARVRAVNDRAERYAAQVAADEGRGLFTLPEEKNYVAAASPSREVAGAAVKAVKKAEETIPAPSAKEFWSKPVASRNGAANAPKETIPTDVSAMAAPSRNAPGGILPPAGLPGVFMVDEEEASARLPRPRAEVTAARAPAREPGRRVVTDPGDAFTPFPQIPEGARIVSSDGLSGFEPLPEPIPLSKYNAMVFKELETGMPGRFIAPPSPLGKTPVPEKAPVRGPVRAPIQEKAQEPVAKTQAPALLLPLPAALVGAKANASAAPVAPVPAKPVSLKPMAAKTAPAAPANPVIPELTEAKAAAEKDQIRKTVKISGADEFSQMKKALEPLPDLTSLQPTPAKSSMKGKALRMPPPMRKEAPAKELPSPEALAAKAAPLDFGLEKAPEKKAEKKIEKEPEAKKTDALPAIPELTEPASSSFIPLPPPLREPEKVTLRPVRKTRLVPELEEIDSATEVPPLKF